MLQAGADLGDAAGESAHIRWKGSVDGGAIAELAVIILAPALDAAASRKCAEVVEADAIRKGGARKNSAGRVHYRHAVAAELASVGATAGQYAGKSVAQDKSAVRIGGHEVRTRRSRTVAG